MNVSKLWSVKGFNAEASAKVISIYTIFMDFLFFYTLRPMAYLREKPAREVGASRAGPVYIEELESEDDPESVAGG